jgi:hypothetical protein
VPTVSGRRFPPPWNKPARFDFALNPLGLRCCVRGWMSALGQKRTSAWRSLMSALPPKADIAELEEHVRFVPIADIAGPRRPPASKKKSTGGHDINQRLSIRMRR